MGRTEREGKCERHPNHRQAKGVCPSCLRERLARLSASSSAASSSSLSSCDSEASSAALPSPPRDSRGTKKLFRLLKGESSDPLRRSQSVAFPAREVKEEIEKKKMKRNKGRKLWYKLFFAGGAAGGAAGGRKKEGDGPLSHSKTMKEKPSSKRVFFA
ncbi:hypothetical protein AXF42_Ash010795 [Apostasia shenzhenica]|uniref:Uncharacterized protein n=1 Tax=Apostasia shenzhenica TaxID=1088818 RepID=A0A2I0A0P7_9ASPA|nr:hypothetical protein AXF42_Ash010795 [Apostasia shenzhenica]